MVVTPGADAEILLQFQVMHHLGAARALLPKSFGQVAFLVGREDRSGKNAHEEVEGLTARNGQHADGGGTSGAQDARTRFHGRARGKYVVDQDKVPAGHCRSVSYTKGAAQVFHTLVPVEARLSRRVAGPLETILNRNCHSLAEERRKYLGLIEFPFAFPRRVKRDGHDRIDSRLGESPVPEPFLHPVRQLVPQVQFPVVLECVDIIPDDPAAQERCNGVVEMERAIRAICAGEAPVDRPVERL
jgi:hypothetical protein